VEKDDYPYSDADVAQGEAERTARLAARCQHDDTYLPHLESIYGDNVPPFLVGMHKCTGCGVWIDPATSKRL
jgi:hypothetical protein